MKKILLIDDDPDVRHLLSHLLQKEGYEVDTASRKEEALEKLAGELPALILLDVLLSGADGRDLCRELKGSEKTKDVPVIMLSGHPGAAYQVEACGADDFLAKPFNTVALLEKLARQANTVK